MSKPTRALARVLALSLSVAMAVTAVAHPGGATLITTEEVAQQAAVLDQTPAGDASRERLIAQLDRPELQARLQDYGLDAEQARERVQALTDEEAHEMVARIDQAPAGAGILGAIVFVFVLLLVTDILGLTKVYPFTRSAR